MKGLKKTCLALLMLSSMAFGVFGFSSCDISAVLDAVNSINGSSSLVNSGEITEIEQVYAQYVSYTEKKGETPLSYEAWLATIKGDKGDQGEQGIQGEKGDKGEQGSQGVGIEKVEYNANGDLVITFTDGNTQTVVMPEKHTHTFGEWTAFTDENTPCEQRLFFRTCAMCSSIEWKQGTYKDHKWSIETTPPTCQSQGYDTKTCTACGEILVENYTEITEHSGKDEYLYDDEYHWQECKLCVGVYTEKQLHKIEDTGYCSICKVLFGTSGLIYTLSNDEMYYAVTGYEGVETEIVIPSTYNGLPITSISDIAFMGSNLTSVVIGSNVTGIGDSAFKGCSSLVSVALPKGLSFIGEFAFDYCTSLKSIEIPDSVEIIEVGAFRGCSAMTYVKLPKSMSYSSLKRCVFMDCTALTHVELPEGLVWICSELFYGCTNLQSVSFTNSVKNIDYYFIFDCGSIKTIRFFGSISEWQAIVKYYSWNEKSGEYVIECNDGTITKDNTVTYYPTV